MAKAKETKAEKSVAETMKYTLILKSEKGAEWEWPVDSAFLSRDVQKAYTEMREITKDFEKSFTENKD